MKKRVLLTGGSGFIGRNARESFLADAYELVTPCRAELDLADTTSADRFFAANRFDAVIHAAAKPGHRNATDVCALLQTNLLMFENLARHRDRFGKLINLGSGAVYDASVALENVSEAELYKRLPADEHGLCKYVVSKRIGSLDGFVDLNIFGIFGRYEDWEIRFISNALCKALCGLPVTLRRDRTFSYLYAPDLMPVLQFFIENKAAYASYNVTPDEPVSLLEVARLAAKEAGSLQGVKLADETPGPAYSGDNARLKAEFSGVRFTPFETAVKELCAWYKTRLDQIDKTKLLTDK